MLHAQGVVNFMGMFIIILLNNPNSMYLLLTLIGLI